MLRDINIKKHYEGLGWSLTNSFIVPSLKSCNSYDRLTSYFTLESLLACAEGIDSIWAKNGHMRLLLGIHSVPEELLVAASEAPSVDALIASARAHVIEDCKNLTDEVARNKIGALAMMLRDGFLEVKVAAPIDSFGYGTGGILHSKRYIFKDESSDIVVAIGSPNETGSALSINYEEFTVHTSWHDPDMVASLTHSFESMWNNKRPHLEVRALDSEFALELLQAIKHTSVSDSSIKKQDILKKVLSLMRSSPEFAFANVAKAALFPHQERALRDSVSRWPIRVLLADEVGLGKTIEAGSVIAYARRFMGAKRVIVFTPAGLMRQWQSELIKHFDISAWRYDSDRGIYVDYRKNEIKVNKKNPLEGAPDCILVSWQLARASWVDNDIFQKSSSRPDLILVDEAHSARRNKGLDNKFKTTLVWELVKKLESICPHLVLLTATPMQMQIEEYHGLMMLLGMPDWWMDADNFTRFLSELDGLKSVNELSNTKFIAEATAKSLPIFNSVGHLDEDSQKALKILSKSSLSVGDFIALRSMGQELKSLGVKFSPPAALTVRNTKVGLEAIGYKFPKRVFNAPILDIDANLKKFLWKVDFYLNEAYGMVEGSLGLSKGGANAFTKSIYYQRLVSTLNSAEKTLKRREEKLRLFIEKGDWAGNRYEDDWDDVDVEDEPQLQNNQIKNVEKAKQEAKIELQVIDDLLSSILEARLADKDLKLNTLKTIVEDKLISGDSILIFSRFTDTVEACISCLDEILLDAGVGYGCYTGQDVWIVVDGNRIDADKNLLCDSLSNGDIKVVFCSDAASEGLNLQTARCLVNVDVPWNPARLEQRIGRIARLGQRSDEVEIFNLWFPNTIESQMYSKLLDRQELYSLAVGEFPDVVGDVIKSRLKSDGDFDFSDLENTLKALRDKAEFSALQRIWASPGLNNSHGAKFRELLYSILEKFAISSGALESKNELGMILKVENQLYSVSTTPGNKDSLSLYHPSLGLLETIENRPYKRGDDICLLLESGQPLGIVIKDKGMYFLLSANDTLQLVNALVFDEGFPKGYELPLSGLESVDEMILTLRKAFPNRIEVAELSISWPGTEDYPAPKLEKFEIIPISQWSM